MAAPQVEVIDGEPDASAEVVAGGRSWKQTEILTIM